MPRYRFPGGIPFLLKFAFVLAVTNIICWMGVAFWATLFGPPRVTGSWSYPVHFKHGLVVFLPHLLGRYIELGLWANLLVIIFMMLYCTGAARAIRVR